MLVPHMLVFNEFHDQYVGSTFKRDAQLGKNNVCKVDDMVAMERAVLEHSSWLHLPTDSKWLASSLSDFDDGWHFFKDLEDNREIVARYFCCL